MIKKSVKNIILTFIILTVFTFALIYLFKELRHHNLKSILFNIKNIPGWKIVIAFGFVIINYFLLGLYDFFAVKYVKSSLKYPKIALTSFISYAFGNNIGFSGLSSSAIRMHFYSIFGMDTGDILKIILYCTSSFWIGLLTVNGFLLTFTPTHYFQNLHTIINVKFLGIIFILIIIIYLILTIFFKKNIKKLNWQIELPHPPVSIFQIIVSSVEWITAGTILYFLLPDQNAIKLPVFLAIFMISQVAGVISNVPGGLGVFEVSIITLLKPYFSSDQVFSALLLYRFIYYILPLLAAIISLAVFELLQRKLLLKGVKNLFGKWIPSFIPILLSVSAFIGGVVLLLSGSIPSVIERIRVLEDFLPLTALELSHFLGSITGIVLIILAVGLQKRLNGAYYLSILFLFLGILFSLLKGLDYEEAATLTVILLFFIPSKKYFFRKSSIFSNRLSLTWIILTSLVLISTVWIGFFSYKHVEYSHDLWWRFEFHKNAPRFLRATLGIAIVILTFALMKLLRPAFIKSKLNISDDIEKAEEIIKTSDESESNLALLGDKHFLFNEKMNVFVMYGVRGRSIISFGDPVGEKIEASKIIWDFYDFCKESNSRPVFYEIGSKYLGNYLELGLSIVKFGETARVKVEDFTLEGSGNKHLRYIQNKLTKHECSFELIKKESVEKHLDDLKIISDKWLKTKNVKEKKFSLGCFDENYLKHFSIFTVKKDNKIIAFSNIFSTETKEELSIDLMRYDPDEIDGIMDYLIINAILWAKENRYKWFNLGMAPLSGLSNRPLAPLWNKIGSFIFSQGEQFYNFKGLHNYKDKFKPIWEPRYIALQNGLLLPQVLTDISLLISGGFLGLIKK